MTTPTNATSPAEITDAPTPFPEASASSKSLAFPFAAAPDIIRANQKDSYFQVVLLERLSDVLRRIYGARILHLYSAEAKVIADFLYFSLTTLRGSRTLGEEYCDIAHVESDSQRLPLLEKRAGFVFTAVVIPYIVTKLLPKFRQKLKLKLERNIQRGNIAHAQKVQREQLLASSKGKLPIKGFTPPPKPVQLRVQEYLRNNLDTFTSTESVFTFHLAVFYFSGAYYHLSKRLWGLRYIFTKRLLPHEQRAGYEVLGVLMMAQILAQVYSHVSAHISPEAPEENSTTSGNAATIALEGGQSGEGQVSLENEKTLAFIQGDMARKCTLCLSPMTDPTATPCGHVFCWGCIEEWCRSKPECPLCRQSSMVQHLLPLRG